MWLKSYKFGTFSVRDVEVPAVMLGTSPFIGAGQFGKRAESYYNHFFLQPENITEVVTHAIGLGVNAVQVIGYPQVVEAVQEAAKRTAAELFLLGTVGLGSIEREIEMLLEAGAQGVIIHGSLADRDMAFAREHLSRLRERGLVTGIATHRPGMTIPRVEEMEEVEIILCPLNKMGRFMDPSVESTLQAIESSSKMIMAIKPLAAGMLSPQEGLSYIADKVVGFAVGIASEEEAGKTFEVAREYFGLSGSVGAHAGASP
jgi:hypothetical protein